MAEQESHLEAEASEPARCFEHQNFKAVRPCVACGEAEVEARIIRADPQRNERREELDRSITLGLAARVALIVPALTVAWWAFGEYWPLRKSIVGVYYLVVLIPTLILCGWWAYEVWKKR